MNTWLRRWCHSADTQFPGTPTLRTISSLDLENTARAPSPLSARDMGASTPVKKKSSFGENPTDVSSCVVSRSSNVLTTLDAFLMSHTRRVPSWHRDRSVFPSRLNATLVTVSPGGCDFFSCVFGLDAYDQWLSKWHCALGGITRPTDALLNPWDPVGKIWMDPSDTAPATTEPSGL